MTEIELQAWKIVQKTLQSLENLIKKLKFYQYHKNPYCQ